MHNEIFHLESQSIFGCLNFRFLEKYNMMLLMFVSCSIIFYTIDEIYFFIFLNRNTEAHLEPIKNIF